VAANFDGSMCDRLPKVYVADKKLDYDASRNLRFEAEATSITDKGFC